MSVKDASTTTTAEVTVTQLANVVGIPVEKLLQQMQKAGLSHSAAEAAVSDEEKQKLLAFLKQSHGETAGEQKKITLKRKSVSKIKVAGSQGARGKTVNVEVRKKRTYVKRAEFEDDQEESAASAAPIVQSATDDQQAAEEQRLKAKETKKALDDATKQKEEALRKAAEAKRAAEKEEQRKQELARKRTTAQKTGLTSAEKAKKAKEGKAKSKESAERQAAEQERTKLESLARKEAEEKARLETLARAKAIAQDLEKRGVAVAEEAGSDEDDLELGSNIVKSAFEESLMREDKSIKKESATKRQARKLKRLKSQHAFEMPVEPVTHTVAIGEMIAVTDLAQQMKVKGVEVVRVLMGMGVMTGLNQEIDRDTAVLVVEEMGHKYTLINENAVEDELTEGLKQVGGQVDRAPVVTIMGHVDHGKTSLLDYIRKSQVAEGEAGGITQHIGAYHVDTDKGMITFLDTPGHAAFTAMRARGANSTDIAIIVVAADDGMMPQTEEAIDHARAAGVPLIIAINKMDKEGADPDRVKSELSQKEIIPEEWGGDHQFIEVSAHTGQGIDALLEAILLQAELLELKAAPEGDAQGVVIEARLDKNRGAVASLLVQSGKLKVGDMVLAGEFYGRVRAMMDENGRPIEVAGPSIPVEILGLAGTPDAGDEFLVVANERKAKEVANFRRVRERRTRFARQHATKLDNLFADMGAAELSKVNLVLKADVRGSLEAITSALNELSTDEVKVDIVSSGVGGINESDINLAMTSGAVIVGFNVRADNAARELCQKESLEIRYYSIIYELIEDIKAAMSGMLSPELREEILGVAEVREVYRSSKFGAAAGCMVLEGTLYRNRPIRVLRDDIVVFSGELESLRRFKDDVQEVRNGTECGIAVKNYHDIKVGDKIEIFNVNEIARSL